MAISPPSDLILDVMRAAEPQRAREAALRLKSLQADAAARKEVLAGGWARRLRAGGAAATQAARAAGKSMAAGSGAAEQARAAGGAVDSMAGSMANIAANSAAGGVRAGAGEGAGGKMAEGLRALEGILLENMLKGMLGGSGAEIYGKGLAGEYWKSMMARAIAAQVSRRGGMGLAAALIRRAGAPDMPAGAASALGMRQQMERTLLQALDAGAGEAAARSGREVS